LSAGKVKEAVQPDRDALAGTLQDLRQLLRFQQAMGIAEYPLNEDVRRFLKFTEVPAGKSVATRTTVARSALLSRPEEALSGPAVLAALRQEVGQCTLCPLTSGRQGTVAGQGSAGSPLMVVGDWSSQEQGCSPEILFGPDEDGMLWKMMEAIALRPEEVYVTNILKCCPGAGQVPDHECRESCFSYLIREIGAVRPRLICAMGDLAVRMLVGSQEPLFRLRGRFTMYRYQATAVIPVMPTFHPRYLLRNPEMKKATWKDLQAIRRRLDQPGN
jgi:uracil-DNA glycosylase family 4